MWRAGSYEFLRLTASPSDYGKSTENWMKLSGNSAPSVMVVESLFHANNSQSLMKLSQVRGVILLLGETHSMDIFEYSPMEIKKGLTGYGRAEKVQMMFMVGKVLALPTLKSPDQADALAMAIYHSHISLPDRVVS